MAACKMMSHHLYGLARNRSHTVPKALISICTHLKMLLCTSQKEKRKQVLLTKNNLSLFFRLKNADPHQL